jgi:hypothetical protein
MKDEDAEEDWWWEVGVSVGRLRKVEGEGLTIEVAAHQTYPAWFAV